MAGDFNKPALADTYTSFASAVRDLCSDMAKGLDPALSLGTTNIPTNTIRWNSASGYWEKFNGSVWNALASTYAINVNTANAWSTGRTITLSSDVTGTSAAWTGSGNLSFATTLATVNSNTGSFGSATAVPVITVNGKGLITAVSTAAIGTMAAQSATTFSIGAAGSVGSINLSNTGSSILLPQSTTQAPTAEGSMGWDTNDDKLVIGNGSSSKIFTPDDLAASLTNKTMGSGCVWNGGTLSVDYGGTGAITFTSGGLLRGNGTSALSIASAADIVAAISTTAVANATVGASVTLTADNTTNATYYPLFASAATGNLSPRTDTGFTYNPSTGELTSTTFIGGLTGLASSATVLATSRAIYGNNFNGSAALTQVISSEFGGTGNGFTKFTGPTTAERTFTLPDATSTIQTAGKQTIWIPAGGMVPRTSNGALPSSTEVGTNKQMYKTLDFDQTAVEYAQFGICMPKSWNAGTVTFKAVFMHASGTGTIGFSLAGVSFASDEVGDVAFGTAVAHTALTVGTANDIYISAESGAVTISGAGASEYVQFQVTRDVATDTLTADARLIGIQLFYTTNTANDN